MRNLPEFAIYASNICSKNIRKACVLLGFGIKSLIELPTDKKGKILIEQFAKIAKE